MKYLIVAITLLACANPARAVERWEEYWTCTYADASAKPVSLNFELSPPELVETASFHVHYRILQNNDYGVVAASSISEIEPGHTQPTVGAVTVVINKGTGEFWLATTIAGQSAAAHQPVHGNCRKN
jgi:hypothetical protein